MFRNHTVFILGAGASFEVGLPLGERLTELIARKLSFEEDTLGRFAGGDSLIGQCLNRKAREDGADIDARTYFRACRLLHNGVLFSKSIDNFLYAHAHDQAVQFCGKLAIAQIILEHESGSKLYFNETNSLNSLDAAKLKNTWFRELFSLLQRNRPKGQEAKLFDGIGIVNFNYDRCIEHFLFNAVRSYYDIDHERAAEVMGRLNIVHPYGTIGGLVWQGRGFAFGSQPNVQYLPFSAKNIRTYNDEISDQTILERSKEILSDAKTVIFLGFGFHQQNLDLLQKCSLKADRIFATVLGRSEDDQKVIRSKLKMFLSKTRQVRDPIYLLNKDCVTAFLHQGLLWSQNM